MGLSTDFFCLFHSSHSSFLKKKNTIFGQDNSFHCQVQCPPCCLHDSNSVLTLRGQRAHPAAAEHSFLFLHRSTGYAASWYWVTQASCLLEATPVHLVPCSVGLSIHSLVTTHPFSSHVTVLGFFFKSFSASCFASTAQMALCQVKTREATEHIPVRMNRIFLPLEGNKSRFSHSEPSAGNSLNPDSSSCQTIQDDFS